jgi:two-component system, OmpR family, sensor histidine kinase KdpD
MTSSTGPANGARPARLVPFVASAGAVLVVGLAAEALTRFVSLPHVSVLFLAPVVMSAALWGLWPAVLAALLSAGAGSFFFYSPIFDFRVAAPQDLADLAVFLIVAGFTSRLAANVRTQAFEARRRQQRLTALLEFTNRLSGAGSDANLRDRIVEGLAPVIGSPIHLLEPVGAVLAVTSARPAGVPLPAEVHAAAERVIAGADGEPPPGWRIAQLDSPQGAVAAVAARAPVLAPDADYAAALLGHAALALEGERLRRAIGEARLKMQGEALREALLGSISHDLQTPLAGILGSVTALQTIGDQGTAATRSELLATIRDEAERLTAHIENVLDLTRIRARQVAVRLELVEIADIINAALRRKHRQLREHAVELRLPPDLPMLRLDLFLMEHALGAVLDNAAKYAPPGSKVEISAVHEDGHVVLDVSDAGSGVAPDELPRVFDAFFRGTGPDRPAAGTGLGLAICRAFVEANGGTVEIHSGGAGMGATVRFHLPVPVVEVTAREAMSDDFR